MTELEQLREELRENFASMPLDDAQRRMVEAALPNFTMEQARSMLANFEKLWQVLPSVAKTAPERIASLRNRRNKLN